MKRPTRSMLTCLILLSATSTSASEPWVIDSQEQWTQAAATSKGLAVDDGLAMPTDKTATFTSKVQRFNNKRKATSITFDQSPIWQNWQPIENLGPVNMQDAPVFLSLGQDNYWAFGKYAKGKNSKGFKPEPATLEGFEDTKLLTTPWLNQYDSHAQLFTFLKGT